MFCKLSCFCENSTFNRSSSLLSHSGSDMDVTLLVESSELHQSKGDHEKLMRCLCKGLNKSRRLPKAMRAMCDIQVSIVAVLGFYILLL